MAVWRAKNRTVTLSRCHTPQFGEIRTFVRGENQEPWFVGKDVADALGYKKSRNAIAAHVDEEDKTSALIQGAGTNSQSLTLLINESGLYSLILASKLPQAREFKHWATSEVLPAIRKTGGYMVTSPEMSNEEILARCYLLAMEAIKQRDAHELRTYRRTDSSLYRLCNGGIVSDRLLRGLWRDTGILPRPRR